MPHFNRWDIAEAYYLYCYEYHGGQWSPEYRALCRVTKFYTPPYRGLTYDDLTENGKAIYEKLKEDGI